MYHVHNPEEFFRAYDQSRDLCMTLQGAVKFNEYFRCYVVGQEKVHIMPYDPRRPHHERYVLDPPEYDKKLLERVEKDALTLCKALGYDLNTVEFAVEDGVPYAIDFMNPAPDADLHSVGRENFDWIVERGRRPGDQEGEDGAAEAAGELQAHGAAESSRRTGSGEEEGCCEEGCRAKSRRKVLQEKPCRHSPVATVQTARGAAAICLRWKRRIRHDNGQSPMRPSFYARH